VASEASDRLYERLPEVYRTEDPDEVFKRYIASVTDTLGAVETLTDRFDYITLPEGEPDDTSDLVDPYAADDAWIPWLAQLVGIHDLSSVMMENRDRIASDTKFQAGTKESMRQAAKGALNGEQHVEVYSHSNDVDPLGDGDQWDVLVVTRGTETIGDPLAEIIRLDAKPAGVLLYHRTYTTTWDAIEAAFPTWADIEGKTWSEIEEAGL
jgi:hypothetical protein